MTDEFTATIEDVCVPDGLAGNVRVKHRWVLAGANGRPIAQQAKPSSTSKAAKQAFARFLKLSEVLPTDWSDWG